MSGYIKLWRELFAKPIWTEASPGHRSVMMEILGLSVWKPTQFELMGKLITLQPGQLAISSRRLAEKARVDRQVVKTALKRLENYHFLTQEVTQQGIVITLVNWGKYQANPEELTHAEPTNKPTANPRLTHGQPTKEEYKEDQEGKKEELFSLVGEKQKNASPIGSAKRGTRLHENWEPKSETLEWARAKRPDLDVKATLEDFQDYWISKPGKDGLKLDWDATFRSWIRRARASGSMRGNQSEPSSRNNTSPSSPSSLFLNARKIRHIGVEGAGATGEEYDVTDWKMEASGPNFVLVLSGPYKGQQLPAYEWEVVE